VNILFQGPQARTKCPLVVLCRADHAYRVCLRRRITTYTVKSATMPYSRWVHLIVCFVQNGEGIGSVHAPRVAGTNILEELCRCFAIVPVVMTTLLCR
jgi:hypothetical protein